MRELQGFQVFFDREDAHLPKLFGRSNLVMRSEMDAPMPILATIEVLNGDHHATCWSTTEIKWVSLILRD